MPIYTIFAHEVMHGSIHRDYAHSKSNAVFQAERLFNRGAYLWVDVILKDKRGHRSYVHHIERAPTDAERAAIVARYAASKES
jgi:hypothetical protein